MKWIEAHEIHQRGNYWKCDDCDRKIRIRPFKIIDKGKELAYHYDPKKGFMQLAHWIGGKNETE